MSRKLILCVLIFYVAILLGCFDESITNSSPRMTESYVTVIDRIKEMSNSESVRLEEFVTRSGEQVVKKELRIDLTYPRPFPDKEKVGEIIREVRFKLIEPKTFDTFTVTEVPRQEGDTITLPAQRILKSITIMAKEL